jgi:hypothetical protein
MYTLSVVIRKHETNSKKGHSTAKLMCYFYLIMIRKVKTRDMNTSIMCDFWPGPCSYKGINGAFSNIRIRSEVTVACHCHFPYLNGYRHTGKFPWWQETSTNMSRIGIDKEAFLVSCMLFFSEFEIENKK